MKPIDHFVKLAGDHWYIQSCNSTPIHIMSAGLSAFSLKKKTGHGYTNLMYEFENDFGKICYYVPDLERLSKELLSELDKDGEYFIKLKKRYDAEQAVSHKFFKEIDALDLGSISNNDLYSKIKTAIGCLEVSVGIGHVIEPFALMIDGPLKAELGKAMNNQSGLNEAFILLTTPTTSSFVQESDNDLRLIAKSKDKEESAREYVKKYFWIRNSYSGRRVTTIDEVIAESSSLASKDAVDASKVAKAKKALCDDLALSPKLISKFETVSFITSWQDERKKHILVAIDYLERLLEGLSLRSGVAINLLRYALPHEINDGIVGLEKELESRRKKSFYFQYPEGDAVFSGKDYATLRGQVEEKETVEIKQVSGNAASLGTAIGRVKVCTTLESLKKVNEGDILVASMTRPEYLPAMQKAAAFVTDEGGITCHAAIVAREMGKPCIIGTKNATKLLRDNDLVEVRGRHGLVIIRERV